MRKSILRSLQALATISAVALLTGANDPGCGLGTDGGGDNGSGGGTAGGSTGTGTAIACAAGEIATWICGDPGGVVPGDPTTSTGSGTPVPVTDPAAPPPPEGTGCEPPPPPPCDGANCPPMPGCVLQCVPAGNTCTAGFHEETVCNGGPAPLPGDPAQPNPSDPNAPPAGSGSALPPPPPPPPPGGTAGGDPGSVPPYPGDPGSCSTICVPDDACPPGTVQQTVCAGGGGTGSGGMGAGGGEPTPVPVDGQCWNECVPADPTCPPGQHEVVDCPPPGYGAPCSVTCQDDPPLPF